MNGSQSSSTTQLHYQRRKRRAKTLAPQDAARHIVYGSLPGQWRDDVGRDGGRDVPGDLSGDGRDGMERCLSEPRGRGRGGWRGERRAARVEDHEAQQAPRPDTPRGGAAGGVGGRAGGRDAARDRGGRWLVRIQRRERVGRAARRGEQGRLDRGARAGERVGRDGAGAEGAVRRRALDRAMVGAPSPRYVFAPG